MKIYGSLVMRNEVDRYLYDCLSHMAPLLDGLFVWDDQSTDDSVEVAKNFTDHVYVRPDGTSSFLEHEGHYRLAAWQKMEQTLLPVMGDWILSFDADEFLVDIETNDPKDALRNAALNTNATGVVLRIPEIFAIEDEVPMRRVDGLWDTIRGPRFFRYQNGGSWNLKAMGCGSEPTYVSRGKLSFQDYGLIMLHYGYADPAEHRKKYERYSSLQAHGHNNSHVNSIIGEKDLVPWSGPRPTLSKGV